MVRRSGWATGMAAGLLLLPAALAATELAATHLVYEKATKMKKVEALLYMSLLDRSVRGDRPGERRSLRCTVTALGKGGPLTARGDVVVSLMGAAADSSAAWRGSPVSEPLDEHGEASFGEEEILGLVNEATAQGVEPELFRVGFDGGKGAKVSQVTLDCLHARVAS